MTLLFCHPCWPYPAHTMHDALPSTRPQNVTPEVVAIAEQAPDEVLEATEAKNDPIARFVLARILSQSAAHSHLQWDTLVDGELGPGARVWPEACVCSRAGGCTAFPAA